MFFGWLFKTKLPQHTPATQWFVPLSWLSERIEPTVDYCVTPYYEDLPQRCHKCFVEPNTEELEPLYIEGKLQYMKIVRYCPNGCGFTVWIA